MDRGGIEPPALPCKGSVFPLHYLSVVYLLSAHIGAHGQTCRGVNAREGSCSRRLVMWGVVGVGVQSGSLMRCQAQWAGLDLNQGHWHPRPVS